MDPILNDYKAYYKVRMQRYAKDPMFERSYKSEQALYNCVCSANSINDLMQTKATSFRELSVQNGVAFVQDQANYKVQFYLKEKEEIKAKGQLEIIDKINKATDAMQIISTVNEIQLKNDTAVLVDNLWPTHFFTDAIIWLEKLEVAQMAQIPDSWKADMQKQEIELLQLFRQTATAFLHSICNYEAGWTWNYEILWAHRHRKKSLLPDAVLQKRIDQHKMLCKV